MDLISLLAVCDTQCVCELYIGLDKFGFFAYFSFLFFFMIIHKIDKFNIYKLLGHLAIKTRKIKPQGKHRIVISQE